MKKLLAAATAIPGDVPLSGVCGGIQLLGLEDTQVRLKWRSSSDAWCNRIGKGCRIFTSDAAFNASLKYSGADVERNVAAGTRKLRNVVRRTNSRSSRPTA